MRYQAITQALFALLIPAQIIAQPGEYIGLDQVPSPVREKFILLYPEEDPAKATWEFEAGGYEAYLKDEKGSVRSVCFFNPEGRLEYRIFSEGGIRTGTEKETGQETLPDNIRKYLAKKYRKSPVLSATVQYNLSEQVKGYRIILDKGQVLFDSEGKVVDP